MGKSEKSKAKPETEFEQAVRLSHEALAHAERHRSPPQPPAYEVWYNYAAGDDPALRERIDRELVKTNVVDLTKIEEIYREHFLEQRLAKEMTAIGDELHAGVRRAVDMLRDGLGENERFVGSLREAQDRISRASRKDEARRAAAELLELARAHVSQFEALNGELDKVRAQALELQEEMQRLRTTAYLDHLTQIWNRRHMDEVLDRDILAARRTNQPLSFALIDLDDFKQLNDTHGHTIGDAVLKHTAGLIKRNVKGQDTPARFGGEEFAIILPKTSLFNARHLVDDIRQQLYETDFVLSRERRPIGQVSASIGLTQLLPDDTKEAMIARADKLLYRAKQQGKNRVESDH